MLWELGLFDVVFVYGWLIVCLFGEMVVGCVVMDMCYVELDWCLFGFGL